MLMGVEPEVTGDAITLRRWDESHLGQLRGILLTSLDHIGAFMSAAASEVIDPEAFLVLVREAWDDGAVFAYAIEKDDKLVGHITFRPEVPSGVLGCWVRVEDTGRGIATAALRVLVKATFEARPEITHLEASCNVANKPSARLLEKVGFLCVGRRTWRPRTPVEAEEELVWRIERS